MNGFTSSEKKNANTPLKREHKAKYSNTEKKTREDFFIYLLTFTTFNCNIQCIKIQKKSDKQKIMIISMKYFTRIHIDKYIYKIST